MARSRKNMPNFEDEFEGSINAIDNLDDLEDFKPSFRPGEDYLYLGVEDLFSDDDDELDTNY